MTGSARGRAVLGTMVGHIAEKPKHGYSTGKMTLNFPVYVACFTA